MRYTGNDGFIRKGEMGLWCISSWLDWTIGNSTTAFNCPPNLSSLQVCFSAFSQALGQHDQLRLYSSFASYTVLLLMPTAERGPIRRLTFPAATMSSLSGTLAVYQSRSLGIMTSLPFPSVPPLSSFVEEGISGVSFSWMPSTHAPSNDR